MAVKQPQKLSVPSVVSGITAHWSQKMVASLNDSYEVKVAKLAGEFIWHSHPETDELFYILSGKMTMRFKEPGRERETENLQHEELEDVQLEEGDVLVVPRGVRHCPSTKDGMEVVAMIMEPSGVVNTGDADRTEGLTNPVVDSR